MIRKKPNIIVTMCMLFAFLMQTVTLPAASLSMDELKVLFKEKTGKSWNDSTSEDRQAFMNDLHGSKKKKARKKRVEGVTVPFYIVEGFARDKGKRWEFATKAEQEGYIKEYKAKEKAKKQKEKARKDTEKQRKKAIKDKQKQQKKALETKKKERKRKKKEKKAAKRKKRQEEKRRLKEAKRKLRELKNKSNNRRSR